MTPFLFGMIIGYVIIATIAWHMADSRGRNKWLAVLSALLVGWATLVYYGIAGNKDSGKEWYGVLAAFVTLVLTQVLLRMIF